MKECGLAETAVNGGKKALFDADPKRYIEKAIGDFVESSPLNRLESFDGAPIYEAPLVGYADGDDPLFQEFKSVVHPTHYTPREILTQYLSEERKVADPALQRVSVISFALPYHRDTIKSNAKETKGPSLRWNHTRWKGQDFNQELAKHTVATLEGVGAFAVAPDLTPFFRIVRPPEPLASTWSQRHVAYASGLGTFSLSDGFITAKGIGVRCGSVVTDAAFTPSKRPYANHLANCRFYTTGGCGACIGRCPGDAITEAGHDKTKCLYVLQVQQKPWLEGAHGPGYIGTYAGCGLCQAGVPCATSIPA